MDSQVVLYNHDTSRNSDERYTPRYAVLPVVKYIPANATVWCPFDTAESEFVRVLSRTNEVVYGHIDYGKDFFTYQPSRWDIIVSNPPFKGKRKFFERALSFGKPFMLLMTLVWLNDAAPAKIFMKANANLQLLMFDKRIHYTDHNGNVGTKTTFSSAYYCRDILPRDIVFETLNRNNHAQVQTRFDFS